MNELLNLSRKISESQDYMTNEQYNMFVDNLANFSEEEQKELAHILLIEVICSPDKLTLKDFYEFQNILGFCRVQDYIGDAMEMAYENYGKKPIFKNNELANEIAQMYKKIKRCEYLTVMAMLNNGFGDKENLKSYFNTLNTKIFNYSYKWKALYIKAMEYIKS